MEAGLASVADAERLIRLNLAPLCLRILVEIETETGDEALLLAERICDTLSRAGIRRPILLHGFNATVWPLIGMAADRGYSTRVGLEDGDRLPDGSLAGANAELVAAASAMIALRRGR